MSPLMYGVVSCHDPCNVQLGPCCLALTPPPHITLAQAGYEAGFRGLFIYTTALIHDSKNALMGVSAKKSV